MRERDGETVVGYQLRPRHGQYDAAGREEREHEAVIGNPLFSNNEASETKQSQPASSGVDSALTQRFRNGHDMTSPFRTGSPPRSLTSRSPCLRNPETVSTFRRPKRGGQPWREEQHSTLSSPRASSKRDGACLAVRRCP